MAEAAACLVLVFECSPRLRAGCWCGGLVSCRSGLSLVSCLIRFLVEDFKLSCASLNGVTVCISFSFCVYRCLEV